MDTNNQQFDPTSLGAKPVQGAFDPTSVGAKPFDGSQDMNRTSSLLGITNNVNDAHTQASNSVTEEANTPYSDTSVGQDLKDIYVEPVKNSLKDTFNAGLRGIGSAVQAPIDMVRSLFGKDPLNNKLGQVGAEPVPTIQSEFADKTLPAVKSGEMSPLAGTLDVTGKAVTGPATFLGFEGAAKQGGKLLTEAGDSLASKSSKGVIDQVSPRLTPKVAEDATTKTTGILGKTTIVPDQRTKDMADAVKDVIKGKSFSEDKELVKGAISKEAETLKSSIKEIDHPVPKRELISNLKNSERPLNLTSDLEKVYDRTISKVSEILHNSDGTVSGILDARKKFDNLVSDRFPNLYNSDSMTPMRTAIKDIRMKMNDFVAEQLPKANTEGSFASFHPEDQKFLTDFAEKVRTKQPVPESLMNRAKETLANYGHSAPNSKTALAEFITNADESSNMAKMSAEANPKLRNVDFKASLRKQNLMYDALDNLSEKAARGAPKVQGEIGTNRISRFADRHPTIAKGAKYVGVGAAGAVGVKEGSKLLGQ